MGTLIAVLAAVGRRAVKKEDMESRVGMVGMVVAVIRAGLGFLFGVEMISKCFYAIAICGLCFLAAG